MKKKINKIICIIDFGLGNLKSLKFKLKKIGIDCVISKSIKEIKSYDYFILAGQGNFKQLDKKSNLNIKKILDKKFKEKNTKFLGICLGMQLFCEYSEESHSKGFGWIKGNVKKINGNFKTPIIGWQKCYISKKNFEKKFFDKNFYFCHSYYLDKIEKKNILTYSNFDNFKYVSTIFIKGKLLGTQFHLEKSYSQGLDLIKNFFYE